MNFTLEQLMERQQGLGGSEIAAALGLSPWKTPYELYIEKTTDDPLSLQTPMTPAQEWGHRLENVLALKYQDDTGYVLIPGFKVHHAHYPWLYATPDRLVYEKEGHGKTLKGLEIKTASYRNGEQWGASGSQIIPEHYYLQIAHYMLVTGISSWDVAVKIDSADFRIYTFERDTQIEEAILEGAKAFWENHVLARKEPPIDFKASGVQELMTRLFPPKESLVIDLDEHWSQTAREAMEKNNLVSSLTKEVKELKTMLRYHMGGAGVARLMGGGAIFVKVPSSGGTPRMTFKGV